MSEHRTTPAAGGSGPGGPAGPADGPTTTASTGDPTAGPGDHAGHTGRGGSARDPLRGSRTSGLWVGTIVASLLLLLLVVFIVQNTQTVEVTYFGWKGQTPLSVALLVATAAGMLLAALVGSMRILQLRRRVRRERRTA